MIAMNENHNIIIAIMDNIYKGQYKSLKLIL